MSVCLFVWRERRSMRAAFAFMVMVVFSGVGYAQTDPAVGGNQLRYRWQPGSVSAYAVDISVDLPDSVQTFKGNIVYTFNGMEGELLKLTYNGGLNKTETQKQRAGGGGGGPWSNSPFFGAPAAPPGPFARNPFMGLENTSNVLRITPRGEVRDLEETSQLPFLLGNLSLLVLELLPAGTETNWRDDSGATVSSKDEDDRGEPSFSPFAKPRTEKRTAASTVTSYSIAQTQGNLTVINKTFQMKAGGEQSLSIDGTGKWTFNRAAGVPEGLDFQQKLSVNVNNVTFTIPMTIKYRRYDEAEWKKIEETTRLAQEKAQREAAEAKAKSDAKAKADSLIPLTPQQKQALIADVKSGDFWRMKGALEQLAAKEPKEADLALGQVILPATKNSSPFVRGPAFTALKKWAPELHVKAELNYRYLASSDTVESPNRPLAADTPLPVGLIVCARAQAGWRGAEVREVTPDGKVKVRYSANRPPWDMELTRVDIQLAPVEVEQPNLDENALAQVYGNRGAASTGSSTFRTWMDNTGSFRIEAQFSGVAEGKVRLRRRDGREIAVPLDRLSEADRQEAERLQKPATVANPFEP